MSKQPSTDQQFDALHQRLQALYEQYGYSRVWRNCVRFHLARLAEYPDEFPTPQSQAEYLIDQLYREVEQFPACTSCGVQHASAEELG